MPMPGRSEISKSQSNFVQRGGKLYGVVSVTDPMGETVQVLTPTHTYNQSDAYVNEILGGDGEGDNGGNGEGNSLPGFDFFDGDEAELGWNPFSAVKKAAKATYSGVKTATKAVANTTKTVATTTYGLTKNPIVMSAIASAGPWGAGIATGLKSVHLVEAALKGDPAAKQQIATIASQAAAGNMTAKKAMESLQAANTGLKAAKTLTAAQAGNSAAIDQILTIKKAAAAGNATAGKAFGWLSGLSAKINEIKAKGITAATNPALAAADAVAVTVMRPYPMLSWSKWG